MAKKPLEASHSVVLNAAKQYVGSGLSLLPLIADGSKQPAINLLPRAEVKPGIFKPSWSPYMQRRPSTKELRDWFPTGTGTPRQGIGIIAGTVSGNLEIIDFDQLKLFKPWAKIAEQQAPGLVDQLVRVLTPRPGMHVYYRCAEIDGNTKLASQSVIDPETGKSKLKCMIETRGEGGYCAAPPSPPGLHTNGPYQVVSRTPLTAVPIISPDERAILLNAARQLDQSPSKPLRQPPGRQLGRKKIGRPGDDFNQRGSWQDILEPHGWTWAAAGSNGIEYWQRPGKSWGVSATVNYENTDLLYVFSTNADPFDADRAYTKFHAYALLEHCGNFNAAAAELRGKGYGSPSRTYSHLKRLGRGVPDHYLTTPLRSRPRR